ncbi:MAG: anaerobic ribonucleoside-triphosphate reductase activating protein [Methanoculleaceae archaeon]
MNFGGFVPISTVDWRGRAVCTLFLRGCPARCWYCQNKELQTGSDMRPVEEILSLIRESRIVVSGLVFSGGEPTAQGDVMETIAHEAHKMGLAVGTHTNGLFPDTLKRLIDEGALDWVALDIKTVWEKYDELLGLPGSEAVQRSLDICRTAYGDGRLPACETVFTVFRGQEKEIPIIAREVEPLDFVIQQGRYGNLHPLTYDEIIEAARSLTRPVRIRTREEGETVYIPEGGGSR